MPEIAMPADNGTLPTVMVTGARGMLGQDLTQVFRSQGWHLTGLNLPEFDVRDAAQVEAVVARNLPSAVVHLAALTDVDACERDPDAAFLTNTLGAHNVAAACLRHDAEMVLVSTLAVFNGEKPQAYTEFDSPDPRSIYSRSKLQAELIVQRLVPRHYIVRAGWLFGGGAHDKKFVAKILAQARQQRELLAVEDKFGSPTYTLDFAHGLAYLLKTGLYGTYHLVNTGAPASRCEVAQHILRYARIKDCQVIPVGSERFPLPAPRPRMEAGRNYLLELRGLHWMRPWAEALKAYVETLVPVDA